MILAIPVLLAGFLTAACTGGASHREESIDFDEIRDREWRLSALNTASGTMMIRPNLEAEGMGDFYTLRFDEDRLNGKAAPNQYFAPYTRGNGQALTVEAPASTLMMALKEPELKEREYFAYLSRITRWNYQDGKLELYTSDQAGGEAVLIFQY
jgi:heat shock protein HslJ